MKVPWAIHNFHTQLLRYYEKSLMRNLYFDVLILDRLLLTAALISSVMKCVIQSRRKSAWGDLIHGLFCAHYHIVSNCYGIKRLLDVTSLDEGCSTAANYGSG